MTLSHRVRPSALAFTRVGALAIAALALAGCAGTPEGDASSPLPSARESTVTGDLTVYAAASLTESFGTIKEAFEAENPDVTITVNFGGSSGLAEGIVAGAPVDVFASASPAPMSTVIDAGLSTETPQTFAANTLEIAVPVGNTAGITGLADFADASKVIALCAPEVPCGAAAGTVFAAAGITPAPDTLEVDVKAALTKVEVGEVDAALVYKTDVIAAGDSVEGIEFPEAADAVNAYPIVQLTDAQNPKAAAAFIEWVLSDVGQTVLADAGFTTN